MQMIWHQQHEPAMPFEMFVVKSGCRKNCIADPSLTELVSRLRHTVD
jgi:hypothetical protein